MIGRYAAMTTGSEASAAVDVGGGRSRRARDANSTRRDILAIAAEEFANKGLAGARIDEIAARTRTSKRMIYYYFGSKEGLYVAVLEQVYAEQRGLEADLHLSHLAPEAAMRRLVGASFDNHVANPTFIRIVMNENLHHGAFIAQSRRIQALNVAVIDTMREILARGTKARVFRKGVDPIGLHMTVSALCFHYVANRHTFGGIFKTDMTSPAAHARRRRAIVDTVTSSIKAK